MHPGRPAINNCPQGEHHRDCALRCKYNYFNDGDLTIHAWELRCMECGLRQTIGFRSDEEEWDRETTDPSACPFCELKCSASGKNLCVEG